MVGEGLDVSTRWLIAVIGANRKSVWPYLAMLERLVGSRGVNTAFSEDDTDGAYVKPNVGAVADWWTRECSVGVLVVAKGVLWRVVHNTRGSCTPQPVLFCSSAICMTIWPSGSTLHMHLPSGALLL